MATVAGTSALVASCRKESSGGSGPAIQNRKTYRWNMVTTWPPNFPVLGDGCNALAKFVEEASEGQMKINVYGGGELIPALEVFDAVSTGTAELGHAGSYYWAGKAEATQLFSTIPFGMNAQEMNSWMLFGGGVDLWRELYAGFNLIPFLAGNTGVQMAGWFNREINSLADFKGLKMRIPGLGGKVLTQVGGTAINLPGGDLYTSLERGVIDATEWIGPYHDYLMGFHEIAKYYYAPGWHEPGSTLEMIVNKQKFDALPNNLQRILEAAATRLNMLSLAEFDKQNAIYMEKIKAETKVEVRFLPQDVMDGLRSATRDIVQDLISRDAFSARVYESFIQFKGRADDWMNYTEKAYYNLIST